MQSSNFRPITRNEMFTSLNWGTTVNVNKLKENKRLQKVWDETEKSTSPFDPQKKVLEFNIKLPENPNEQFLLSCRFRRAVSDPKKPVNISLRRDLCHYTCYFMSQEIFVPYIESGRLRFLSIVAFLTDKRLLPTARRFADRLPGDRSLKYSLAGLILMNAEQESEFQESLQIYEKLLTSDPANFQIIGNMGWVYHNWYLKSKIPSLKTEGMRLLEKSIRLCPQDSGPWWPDMAGRMLARLKSP